MLIIRREQMDVLKWDSMARFEAEMTLHLSHFAPKLYEIRGETTFRELVRYGVAKAAKFEFSKRGPIRFVLESMLAFGSEFDTDPQIPGIKVTSKEKPKPDQMVRAEKWFAEIDRFVKHTKGPNNQYAIDALKKLSQSWIFKNDSPQSDSRSRLFEEMHACYPEKTDFVGHATLERLYQKGARHAREKELPEREGALIITALMFALGHGVLEDPMYPWVNQTLMDVKYGDGSERMEKLKIKSKIYLDRTLSYLHKAQ